MFVIGFIGVVIVPLLSALWIKRLGKKRWLTFVITTVANLLLPLALVTSSIWASSTQKQFDSPMILVTLLLMYWGCFIPAALIVQLITNAIVWRWGNYLK
jgi:hypothetical protein